MGKVYIETYGCQMNVADTEVVFAILGKAGFSRTEDIAQADVILVNTCSVRDNAEQRIRGRIEQFNFWRKARPGVLVGVLGCMAERLKESLLESGKVDVVAGPDAYRNLPLLLGTASDGHPQIDVLLSREETYGDIAPLRVDKNGVSAFISIMRGCNNVCSYCVVPYTRGAERSRDWRTIVREACECAQAGYKEVTLLGQNVDSYGKDFLRNHEEDKLLSVSSAVGEGFTKALKAEPFAALLKAVDQVPGVERVHFMTSHPRDMSEEVIKTVADGTHLCEHVHVALQSGSSRILKAMNRGYTRERFLELVKTIRKYIPQASRTMECQSRLRSAPRV